MALDINREIGFIRNVPGGNWMAIALKRVQDAVNGAANVAPSEASPSASVLLAEGPATIQKVVTVQPVLPVPPILPVPPNPVRFFQFYRQKGLSDQQIADAMRAAKDGNFVLPIDPVSGSPVIDFAAPQHTNKKFSMDAHIVDGLVNARMPATVSYSASGNLGTGLAQSGTTTLITVSAGTFNLGSILLSYNSGSVDPGAFGTYFIYFDDFTYGGGAETFQATTDQTIPGQFAYRFYVGKITTVSTGGGTGGGGGGFGGCCEIGTRIEPLGGVLNAQEAPWGEWCKLVLENETELSCVPEHPVYSDKRGKMSVIALEVGEEVVTKSGLMRVKSRSGRIFRASRKIIATVPGSQLYWANGILSHNFKPL